jgi:hypothetical protein
LSNVIINIYNSRNMLYDVCVYIHVNSPVVSNTAS